MRGSSDRLATLRAWRQYVRQLKQGDAGNQSINGTAIGLAGSFTLDALVPYLGGEMILDGCDAPAIFNAPYNRLHQLCLDPQAVFEERLPDVLIILWRLEDIVSNPLDQALSDETAFKSLFQGLDTLLHAIRTLREGYKGGIIVSTPPYPSVISYDPREPMASCRGVEIHARITRYWNRGLADIDRVQAFDLHGLLQQEGYDVSHDPVKWYMYRQPYTDSFLATLAMQLHRKLSVQTKTPKKCVVVDCDNTLWGGIVGEEGISGIKLGGDFPGSAFVEFQRALLRLRGQGVFIAVASKNNPEDVFEVFDHHDSMVLKREHVIKFCVHWKSKVDSLLAIAGALNIGTDALVFIDDSPTEVEEVRRRLPEVSCRLVPEEIALLPRLLLGEGLFDTATVTREDHLRAGMFKIEEAREQQRASMSEEDFLNSLELTVEFFEAGERHVARIAQLINKTNQFNLTTKRRSQDEVAELSSAEDVRIFAIEVSDRFGDYGLVGVAILQKLDDANWLVDTFLMSCRALGRGIESVFLARLANAILETGSETLVGQYLPTRKNKPAEDFYRKHGFEFDPTAGVWIASSELLMEIAGNLLNSQAL